MMKPKGQTEHDEGMLEYLEDIIGSCRLKEPIQTLACRIELLNEHRGEKVTYTHTKSAHTFRSWPTVQVQMKILEFEDVFFCVTMCLNVFNADSLWWKLYFLLSCNCSM